MDPLYDSKDPSDTDDSNPSDGNDIPVYTVCIRKTFLRSARGNFVIISPPPREGGTGGEATYSTSTFKPKNDVEALLSGLNISCPSSLSIERLLTDDFSSCSPSRFLVIALPRSWKHCVPRIFRIYRSVSTLKHTLERKGVLLKVRDS